MIRYIFIITIVAIAALSHAQEIPNGSFEEWVEQGNDTVPQHWSISQFGSGQTTDAAQGTSAITIWNWYSYAKGTLESNGIPFPSSEHGALLLRGKYKYLLGENGGSGHSAYDSAQVFVLLKNFNEATQYPDTVAFTIGKLGPSNEYRDFSVSLPFGRKADTLVITFWSSESGFCSSADGQCLYLTLDDLSLSLQEDVVEAFQPVEEPAIPNPFETETLLGIAPDGGCRVYVSNMEAIDVYEQAYRTGERMVLTSSDIPSGTYLYRIVSKDGIRSGKMIRK